MHDMAALEANPSATGHTHTHEQVQALAYAQKPVWKVTTTADKIGVK